MFLNSQFSKESLLEIHVLNKVTIFNFFLIIVVLTIKVFTFSFL